MNKSPQTSKMLKISGIIFLNIIFALVGIKILDMAFFSFMPPLSNMLIEPRETPDILSLELHPYTGLHVRANTHETSGVGSGGEYKSYDITSGDKGFFVDFPLATPPSKSKDEFRVVLTGPSAAQGWGAQSNEKMMYRRLEIRANELLQQKGSPRRVRVINMAMAASSSYQNYISLNKWGHPLQPDLILSFSGITDITVPAATNSDLPYHYGPVLGLVESAQYSNTPTWVMRLKKVYPGLVRGLRLDQVARLYKLDKTINAAVTHYAESNRVSSGDYAKNYAHAINSIQRDFPGTPVLVVFQPLNRTKAGAEQGDSYRQFIAEALPLFDRNIRHYDLDLGWSEPEAKRAESARLFTNDQAHLNNEGQDAAAQALAKVVVASIGGK